jgi:hypothetical protein
MPTQVNLKLNVRPQMHFVIHNNVSSRKVVSSGLQMKAHAHYSLPTIHTIRSTVGGVSKAIPSMFMGERL